MAETEFARAERLFREVCELERQLALERERAKVLIELVESDIGCDQEPKITTDVVQYIHSDNCRKCRALAKYRGGA